MLPLKSVLCGILLISLEMPLIDYLSWFCMNSIGHPPGQVNHRLAFDVPLYLDFSYSVRLTGEAVLYVSTRVMILSLV